MKAANDPVRPAYTGANVRGIVPALLGPRSAPWPGWIPAHVQVAGQVVLLVIDGLGWNQLRDRAAIAPTLASMDGGPITTVAPSTTATALASIATGLTPGEHGLVGYRVDIGGEVLNVLRWQIAGSDARRRVDPRAMQPFAPFLGERVPVVGRAQLEASAFSEAHLRGTRPMGYRLVSSLPVVVGELLARGERFVYAYYDGIDKIAHERGFGPFYDAELRAVDSLVAALIEQLPPGAVLVVTADHGQVQVGERLVTPHPEVLAMVRAQSGEGRFRWLHARHGAVADLRAAALQHYRDVAWVLTRDELIGEQWFGAVVSPPVASRYGDVALVPFAPLAFHDPDDSGSSPLICRHGSLTADEMLVPLLAAGSG